MKDDIVVKRYSEAFIEFADKTIGLDKALEDFKKLKGVIRVNPDFFKVLTGPMLTYREKSAFADKALKEDISRETMQFLKLLIEKERVDKLKDIADFLRIHYARGRAKPVVLKTSFPLDLELIKEVENRLEKKLKKKFKFYIALDGSLLGGIRVEIGHLVIDNSVRKRLDELKKRLMALKV